MARSLAVRAFAAFAICIGLALPASAKTLWKVNILLTQESELGLATAHFAKRVKELTNGEIEVDVFYNGQLGKNIPVVMQSLVSGDLDGFVELLAYFGNWDKRQNIIACPYCFKSFEQFDAFLKSPLFQEMSTVIYDKGIKIVNSDRMNWFKQEQRGVLMRKPVFLPDDLKSQKIRQYQAEMPIKGLMALGANVQVIPWPDVYTALMTGTVDGLETTLAQTVQSKHVEAAKYYTTLELYYQVVSPSFSRKSWEKLTDPQKKAVEQAIWEGGEVYKKESTRQLQEYEKIAMEQFDVKLIRTPLKPWIEKIKPAHEEFIKAGLIPKETIDYIAQLKY